MKTISIYLFVFFLYSTTWAQNSNMSKRIQAMTSEKDPQTNILTMYNIIKDFKLDTLKNAEEIDILKGQVALSFLQSGQYPQFENFIGQLQNKFNQTSYLNMATAMLLKNKLWTYAHAIAQKTVTLYESFKDQPNAKPADFPLADWNRFMQMAAYPYYESYAETLYAIGDAKKALFYEEKAIKDQDLNNLLPTSVALYTTLLTTNEQRDKAYQILLQMARIGKASLDMNKQLQKLLTQKMGDENKALSFLDSIQKNSVQSLQMEIAKKMINQVAPPFTLQDLSGKKVTLHDFIGKIVVIDFWATWCAPCIASMPAMQALSNKHPEIVFVFIATKETATDAHTRIKTYVQREKFPLNVLIDQPQTTKSKIFPVAEAYQLKGLPTKVVIDKKGKLRFSTEGYTADTALINELEAMIALCQTL